MRLHIDETGTGPRAAVLLHGLMGSAESWWRIAPLLVARGYRVLAVDLPGHGLSDRDPALTIPRAADAVTRAVAHAGVERPALAIGHSFGGIVLGEAFPERRPEVVVYVDAPLAPAGGGDPVEIRDAYERDRRSRTAEALRISRPEYSERDREAEGRAAERFDPATAAALAAVPSYAWEPEPGSIVVRADPSRFVSAEEAARLAAAGVDVRSIPGAAHSVWYSHFAEFTAALPEAFG
ncbi:alpha/beta fold hydrolase [Clavibacter sp. VKM Ac-2542]|uniref:alpha/beta fold hydrolase n=1 Tax=Clavibacter sp. VKM Ac-2542 TaxID=2783811 RepID=UPI00188C96BD|nr:alpha/beta fold hydrolase [Clavibacter sp. VKM Ac-2542]MBF4621669.1 alpha/beta fold hydrolase [Clavibacter sp. VKM Ac-2542]